MLLWVRDEDKAHYASRNTPQSACAGITRGAQLVPESRSRKKQTPQPAATTHQPRRRGGGRWVAPVMLTCLVLGLLWIVVFYLAGSDIPGMRELGNWNLAVGMTLILVGLVTAMRWD